MLIADSVYPPSIHAMHGPHIPTLGLTRLIALMTQLSYLLRQCTLDTTLLIINILGGRAYDILVTTHPLLARQHLCRPPYPNTTTSYERAVLPEPTSEQAPSPASSSSQLMPSSRGSNVLCCGRGDCSRRCLATPRVRNDSSRARRISSASARRSLSSIVRSLEEGSGSASSSIACKRT